MEKVDKKKKDRFSALQEISVKNFIIEGGDNQSTKDRLLKKRESSYVLKQKFA